MQTITAQEFDKDVLQAEGLVLVDFGAAWCNPCRRLEPELAAVAQDMAGQATIYKVDIDASPEVAAQYGVQGIPRMIFFKGGKVVDSMIGLHPKAQIESALKRHL